jgi:hypothetical protein
MAKTQAKTAKTQSELFIEKAREIGANDDADASGVMRQLARQPKAERQPLKKKKAAK